MTEQNPTSLPPIDEKVSQRQRQRAQRFSPCTRQPRDPKMDKDPTLVYTGRHYRKVK